MAWSWGKKTWGSRDDIGQFPSKKRKVEEKTLDIKHKEQREENKDVWGDDEEFTQDELEKLDIIASQAINQPERPVTVQSAKLAGEVSFIVPYGSIRGAVVSRSGSSSDSSVLPRSLSSRSTGESSTSLPSSNGRHDMSRDKVQAKLDEEEERRRAKEEKYQYDGEMKSLRERLHKQEEELERLRAIRDERAEQQQQAQVEKVVKLQLENESLTSQIHFKERECQSLQEKNTILQQKMKRLQQQSQAGGGHTVVGLTQSQKSVSPQKVPVQPSPPSKLKQQEMKEAIGIERNTFPTKYSFMEQTVSTMNVLSARPGASTIACQTTEIPFATKPPQNRRLHLHARVSNGVHQMIYSEATGSQVVRHLLQTNDSETSFESKDGLEKGQWDPGLVGLLHDMSTSLKVSGLSYSRRKGCNYLSPHRPIRHTQGQRSSDSDSIDETVHVVTRQNLQLAIQGLTLLLEDAAVNKNRSSQDSNMNMISSIIQQLNTHIGKVGAPSEKSRPVACDRESSQAGTSCHVDLNPSTSKVSRSSSSSLKESQNFYNSGAVMLLPLLTDYIQHYVDLINSTVKGTFLTLGQVSIASPQSLDSSRSYAECSVSDSSFEFLGSQLGQLLHEGKIYASCVEMYAMTALRCLVLLTKLCPEIGDVIIANASLTVTTGIGFRNSTMSSSSNMGTETDQQSKKSSSSSGAADDEHSTSSSEIRVIVDGSDQSPNSFSGPFINGRVNSTLLHLIMRLAGQDLEDNQSNAEAIKLALNSLTYLCQCCIEDNLPKLESIIARGILTNCFRQTKHIPILIWAQRLLVSLIKSDKTLVRLCTKSENCPLYLMHKACSIKTGEIFSLCREYIITLTSIISAHRSGLHHLLSNTCPCAKELVKTVTTALYNLFSTYKTAGLQHKQEILNTLAQGVILIHSLVQGDSSFSQLNTTFQLQYVRLLSGVASIMKSNSQAWEFHLSTLEDFCDFDICDTSHDSEEDDKIDQ